MQQVPVHPAAELFPLMDGADFDALKLDIAANGLREPIWLCDGKILDGRNRYRACEELGIEPKFASYEGESPTAFVWSLNGARRHLTKSQLATIAVEMLPHIEAEAKSRMTAGNNQYVEKSPMPKSAQGTSRDIAAKLVGVGHSMVQIAKTIKENDPETFERVKRGVVKLSDAERKVRHERLIPEKPRNVPRDEREKQIRELVAEGHRAAQIAEHLGIGEQQVRNIAGERGIALPDAMIGKTRKIDAHRVIETTVHGLEGYAQGLAVIAGGSLNVDAASAASWADSLRQSLAPINRLRKQLLEVANGH